MESNNIKITVITTTFNSEKEIINLLESVKSQSYQNIEHIFIDSFSSDMTRDIIRKYQKFYNIILIEEKCSIYEGYNIGIRNAKGQLINFIGSDDVFSNKYILEKVAKEYDKSLDLIYGDISFLDKKSNRISRIYKSGKLSKNKFRLGFMPAHTSMFFSKSYISNLGFYNLNYKIASDFDFCLRAFMNNANYKYLKIFVTFNKEGGTSNKNIKNIITSNFEILKILKQNKIYSNLILISFKLLLKFFQKFFLKFFH